MSPRLFPEERVDVVVGDLGERARVRRSLGVPVALLYHDLEDLLEVAGGALNEQLDRARELFDTQLHFHREMLMQLRGVHLAAETRLPRQDEDAPA